MGSGKADPLVGALSPTADLAKASDSEGSQTWIVKSSSTLQSGHPVTATTQVTRVNPDTITFQVRNQKVDGNPIPDSAVVTMQRVN